MISITCLESLNWSVMDDGVVPESTHASNYRCLIIKLYIQR